MISDFKSKRQAPGFIRTNSSKALPTFKVAVNNESSDDFSSFENNQSPRHPEQSDAQFSPYKNSQHKQAVHLIPTRPPLPPKAVERSASNERLALREREMQKQLQKQKQQRAMYAKMRREQEEVLLQKKENLKIRPNHQQQYLFSNEKLKSHESSSANQKYADSPNYSSFGHRREEQLRDNLWKRIEVEKQLAQIGKVCNEIEQIKRESLDKRDNSGFKYQDQQRSLERKKVPNSKETITQPPLRHFGRNEVTKQEDEEKVRRVSFGANKQKYEFESDNDNVSESSISEEDQYRIERPQKVTPQQQNQKKGNVPYETIFKAGKQHQILSTVDEYKRLHSQTKSSQKDSATKYGEKYEMEERIREEHQRARNKFISNRQKQQQNHESEEEEEEQGEEQPIQEQSSEEQEELINEYPTQEFKTRVPFQNRVQKKTLENQSGVHKAKGGICFDLDIAQFTQPDPKPRQVMQSNYNANNSNRRGKKVNTKQEILKRRQMAKNYDKMARAKVFSAF